MANNKELRATTEIVGLNCNWLRGDRHKYQFRTKDVFPSYMNRLFKNDLGGARSFIFTSTEHGEHK